MKINLSYLIKFLIWGILMELPIMSVSAWPQTKSGNEQLSEPVSLRYNYPGSKQVRYLNTTKVLQTMDINGQSMDVNVNGAFGCTIKAAGLVGNDLKLEVVVDTLGQSTESPMGSSGGPITDINGKSFSVIIAPNGKSIDFTEAEKIVYNIEGSGESNLTTEFDNFFPVLPANPVKPGDTWVSADTLKMHTKSMKGSTIVNSVTTLDSLYIADGVEWARMKSRLSGTEDITVQNQGMDIRMTGPYEGSVTVLFDVKQGYYVRQTGITKMTGNIEMSQPDVMKFPVVMTRNFKSEMLNEVGK
jgi:hypothetical protein